MPERQRRYDPDERFSLSPLEGEDALRHLLRADDDDDPDQDDPAEASEP